MSVRLQDPVTGLDGVGRARASKLQAAFGIRTVADLLAHYPRRYRDAGEVMDLTEVVVGEPATLLGEVLDWSTRRVPARRGRRGMTIVKARVRQAGGAEFTASFFNQDWRTRALPPGTVAAFSGKVARFKGELELKSPDVHALGRVASGVDAQGAAQRLRHQRLLAVYPAVEGLTSLAISDVVARALDDLEPVPEWLPDTMLAEHGLLGLDEAVRAIHRPDDPEHAEDARRRLVFDELLAFQLGVQWRRMRRERDVAGLDNGPRADGRAQTFVSALPFAPTGAQLRAFEEIGHDLGSTRPMHRLLQGDVGSGKTVVATWTMLAAVDAGRQAALMVPTEVLADQHLRTLTELLAPLGVNVLDGVRVDALTSSTPANTRRRILGELLTGELDLVVGTHALLEEGVRFADLGVVVVDEQHRFGVAQRAGLKEKAAQASSGRAHLPDVLVMTATPIPRSLAMTLYGDLDVTVLDELPAGRQAVRTELITPSEAHRRQALYEFVRSEAREGRRTYVVCPFVEPSEAVSGTSAVTEHRRLAEEVLGDLDVALVHGQMPPDAKEAAMGAFRDGRAQVLVSTTVVEVGVDVPEATVMVVEDAERFGISQLHQLRGRVGRGTDRSFCVLFAGWNTEELTDEARRRLEAVSSTSDGFVLAETDLELRGAGRMFGESQSGTADLRLTRPVGDLDVIAATREVARRLIGDDPDLEQAGHRGLRAELERRYDGGLEAFDSLEIG